MRRKVKTGEKKKKWETDEIREERGRVLTAGSDVESGEEGRWRSSCNGARSKRVLQHFATAWISSHRIFSEQFVHRSAQFPLRPIKVQQSLHLPAFLGFI